MATIATSTAAYFNRTIQYRPNLVVVYDNRGHAEVTDEQAELLDQIDESVCIVSFDSKDPSDSNKKGDLSDLQNQSDVDSNNESKDSLGGIDYNSLTFADLQNLAKEFEYPLEEWSKIKSKEKLIEYLLSKPV